MLSSCESVSGADPFISADTPAFCLPIAGDFEQTTLQAISSPAVSAWSAIIWCAGMPPGRSCPIP